MFDYVRVSATILRKEKKLMYSRALFREPQKGEITNKEKMTERHCTYTTTTMGCVCVFVQYVSACLGCRQLRTEICSTVRITVVLHCIYISLTLYTVFGSFIKNLDHQSVFDI